MLCSVTLLTTSLSAQKNVVFTQVKVDRVLFSSIKVTKTKLAAVLDLRLFQKWM